jgi:hypothetical protein
VGFLQALDGGLELGDLGAQCNMVLVHVCTTLPIVPVGDTKLMLERVHLANGEIRL